LSRKRTPYESEELPGIERFPQQNNFGPLGHEQSGFGVAGHENHRGFGPLLREPFSQHKPVYLWHDDVGKQQVNGTVVCRRYFEGVGAISSLDDMIAIFRQNSLNKASNTLVIIY